MRKCSGLLMHISLKTIDKTVLLCADIIQYTKDNVNKNN